MQMRFSKDKLANPKEKPCLQMAVCLIASPMEDLKKKKASTVINKT